MVEPSSPLAKPNLDPSGREPSSVKKWFARLPIAFLIVALVAGIACAFTIQYDRSASELLRQSDLPGDIQKAIALSETFAHGFGVLMILLSVYVIAVNRRRAVVIAILITALSGITANALKAAVVRVRPHAQGLKVIGHNDVTVDSTEAVKRSLWDSRQRSFPSGHSATAWGLAIGLSLVFTRGWWIFGILAVLASVQRIESGAHYPSDVLAGMSIAFIIAACTLTSQRVRKRLEGVFCLS